VKLTEGYQNMFRIPELKRRLLFTAFILIIYRLGGHVPVPGVDPVALKAFFDTQRGTLLSLYDMFSGGNLEKATIFALGIMPYISASIILQLMQAVVPALEKLAKEGEEGRAKITQWTRYGTVLLATIQAAGISIALENFPSPSGAPIVPDPGLMFKFTTIVTLVAGTIFVMWLGEQITERGIGNGISLIITIGIIAAYPTDILRTIQQLQLGEMSWIKLLFLMVFMVAVIAAIILVTQGQRRIPVQYAKKMVGRRMYGGSSTHIPLKVNTAGVIPIIFAQSIIMFPATLAQYFPNSEAMQALGNVFAPGAPLYIVIYSTIIVFFAYFYTAVVLNPVDLADNMKKYGGFIPGIRPGKRTAELIDRVLTRVTLPGAIFLAAIAVLPDILIRQFNVPFYFGGTGLLIVVGVSLDTLQQIESHLLMRNYDGFLKRGKLRGRR
jgi:preprotein translocase subunit SecY